MPDDRETSGPEPIPAEAVVRLPRSLLQPDASAHPPEPPRSELSSPKLPMAEAPAQEPAKPGSSVAVSGPVEAPSAGPAPVPPKAPAPSGTVEVPSDREKRDDNVTRLEPRRRPPYFGRRDWTSLAIAVIAVLGVGALVARLHAAGWSDFAEMFARP